MIPDFLHRLFRRDTPTAHPHARAGTASRPAAEDPVAAAVREATTRPKIDPAARPEDLCGLTPSMSPEAIRGQLARLHRRHNRAAASLNRELREEADIMLDAIARCRERFLGVPAAPPPPADS